MTNSASAKDKIFVHEHYAIHYRQAARAQWAGEARPVYAALFVLGGSVRWQAGDGRGGELRAPGLLVSAPGELTGVRGGKVETLALSVAPAFVLDCAVRARLTRDDARITFPAQAIEHDPRLARLAHDLADELRAAETGHELIVAALIEQILIQLLRRYASIRRTDELELSRAGLIDRRIRRAVELMHSHLDAELPLEELAAAAYLSPFHFARLFKKLTGLPPHAYLAALRIERARTLLAATDDSITEIAARVGYANSSHFGKAFRRFTGLTPRAFRAALVKAEVRG
ncbi:MAG TPA: AraC family transcriptional regulator [Pyrinomonadaceae bacterium]|jgi:AraC family transcriptional regulator|nr:AraC family transcriptional regulator [Pyrinomonadaceae bacterium]